MNCKNQNSWELLPPLVIAAAMVCLTPKVSAQDYIEGPLQTWGGTAVHLVGPSSLTMLENTGPYSPSFVIYNETPGGTTSVSRALP